MRKILVVTLIFCAVQLRGADFSEIKKEIEAKESALILATSEAEKSRLLYELALAYFQDQETEKAFLHFLEALKWVEAKTPPPMDFTESSLYNRALDLYLSGESADPTLRAKELLESYGECAAQNPHYLHLNFLVATAFANLGRYGEFFERFYKGYAYLQQSFLAYKTRGILCVRLSQHCKSSDLRCILRGEAMHYLTHALNLKPNDPSLYRTLVFLAKDEKNEEMILTYLQRLIENQVGIARGDICLYVKEAVALGDYKLGQALIDLAKRFYEYSRALSCAQEYLNQKTRIE